MEGSLLFRHKLEEKKTLVAFRKYRNLMFFFERAKVYAKQRKRNPRFTSGLYKCMNSCPNYAFIKVVKNKMAHTVQSLSKVKLYVEQKT